MKKGQKVFLAVIFILSSIVAACFLVDGFGYIVGYTVLGLTAILQAITLALFSYAAYKIIGEFSD